MPCQKQAVLGVSTWVSPLESRLITENDGEFKVTVVAIGFPFAVNCGFSPEDEGQRWLFLPRRDSHNLESSICIEALDDVASLACLLAAHQ